MWTRQFQRFTAVLAAVALMAGCATGAAFSRAKGAAKTGDWDTAVAEYRVALSHDPSRMDIKIALAFAMREASNMHMTRAKQLEAQDQVSGAAAEYHLAADVDPGNTVAASKAAELDRKIRDQIEANRPKPAIDALRAQARQMPVVPTLDPRLRVTNISFANGTSVKDILAIIAARTGINIIWDQAGGNIEQAQNRAYAINVQDESLESVLNQVLSANLLFYKVVDPKTILIAVDNQQNRQRLEDQAFQTFYISQPNYQDISTMVQTMLTQLTTLAVRPQLVANKTANTITVRASLPTLKVIEELIKANDKPRAELVIDIEVLEVDRKHIQQYGFSPNFGSQGQVAAFQFSPTSTPPGIGSASAFPAPNPAPINLNSISNGASLADWYLSLPSVQLSLMESDAKTKILAQPELRGAEGASLSMNLGDKIPVLNSTTPTVTGGLTAAPTTSYTYQNVGVNITITPYVSAEDEVTMDISVENSQLGADILVAGVSIPEITDRLVKTTLRLRDGETNLLAGLLSQNDSSTLQGLPGVNRIPLLRSIFGSTQKETDQSDIIFAITPHIIRNHELTAGDLAPIYVGTQQNFGLTGPPPLIAPPDTPPTASSPSAASAAGAAAPATSPVPPISAGGLTTASGAPIAPANAAPPPPSNPSQPTVVPVQPVQPPPLGPSSPAQVVVVPPGTEFSVGGGPYNVPVLVSNVSSLGSLTLTVTYDPKVLRVQTVTLGPAMQQGGVTPAFTPKIDQATGRVDIVISRGSSPGINVAAAAQGLLAALVFEPVAAGASPITLSGLGMTAGGQPISLNFASTNVTVK